jgi:hypothetical protein
VTSMGTERLPPLPCTGSQSLWTYPDSVDGLWLVDDAVGG